MCAARSSGPGPRTEVNQKYQSSTDPEATLVRQHGVKTRARYKNHRVVGDAWGIVTAIKTTAGRINEGHELMGLIDQHQANAGVSAYTIVAGCKYGTIENYVACQSRKLRTHMADLLASSPGSGRRDGIYPESQFPLPTKQQKSDTFLNPPRFHCGRTNTYGSRWHLSGRHSEDSRPWALGTTAIHSGPYRRACGR